MTAMPVAVPAALPVASSRPRRPAWSAGQSLASVPTTHYLPSGGSTTPPTEAAR